MSIKTILVPTDFSAHALRAFEVACDLAVQLGAKLYLLHVQMESDLRTAIKEGCFVDAATDEELHDVIRKLIEERFSKTLSAVDHSQISIEHTSRRGDADAVITAYATEIGADLIVVGRRGTGFMNEIRAAVVGSVTQAVIRKAPCPVLVVRLGHTGSR